MYEVEKSKVQMSEVTYVLVDHPFPLEETPGTGNRFHWGVGRAWPLGLRQWELGSELSLPALLSVVFCFVLFCFYNVYL